MEDITKYFPDGRCVKSVSDEAASALYKKLGYRMSVENEVNAAGRRILDGIKNGQYTARQAEDIGLIADFIKETTRKSK